jgi:hypothetical protein
VARPPQQAAARHCLRRPSCSAGLQLNRGAPAIEEEEAEVSVQAVEHRDGWSDGTAVAARSLVMAAMATTCTVAALYDGEERPRMVAVVAAVRGGGGGVLHSAFDRTIHKNAAWPRALELGHGGVRAREPRVEHSEIEGSEREWRGALVLLSFIKCERARTRGSAVGARLARSRHEGNMRCPLRHSAEQVASAGVAVVGHHFGPVTG